MCFKNYYRIQIGHKFNNNFILTVSVWQLIAYLTIIKNNVT